MVTRSNITTERLRQLLIPTHLYYDLGSASLRNRAFAEIISKVLFLAKGHRLNFEEIAPESAKLVGVKKLPHEDIEEGLQFLKEKGAASFLSVGQLWALNTKTAKEIESDIDSSQVRIKKILTKYFGTKIDIKLLEQWFKSAGGDLFGAYGDVWVKTIYHKSQVNLPGKNFLKKQLAFSLKKHGLESYSDELIEGFHSFLSDFNEPINVSQIWSFAQAMLSAKLVTAGIGPDPITISEFQNAKFLLDTNILFIAALEKSRLSQAFSTLAESLHEVNVTLHITERTQQEYKSVVNIKKEKILKLVSILQKDLLRNVLMDSGDSFALTALARGCNNLEDYKNFFDSIENPLTLIEKTPIQLEIGREISKIVKESESDVKKHRDISEEWLRYHFEPKPKMSVNHDAVLDSVAEYLRDEKTKAWILTGDRSMQSLSQKWAGSSLPTWISLDAVIQLLAIYGAGPGHDPEKFAPLLSKIIEAEVQYSESLYTIEDVAELIDIEERVKELSKDEIKEFANKVAKARMSGKQRYDKEIALEVKRVFQGKKISSDQEIQKIKEQRQGLEQELAAAASALVKNLKRKKKIKEIIKFSVISIVILAIGIWLMNLGLSLLKKGSEALGLLLIVLGITEVLLPFLKWVIPNFKKSLRDAEDWAQEKAKELIEKQRG